MILVGDIIQKTGDPGLLAVEAEKTVRAFEIGKNSGLFCVPKVVNLDTDTGLLEFERLEGLATLLDLAISKDPRLFDLLKKAGRSLSVIHEQLILPDEMKH
jgi:tRNA A-37 threonylcarbamoyl transferase component Bud32